MTLQEQGIADPLSPIARLIDAISSRLVGHARLVERLAIGLLAGGHLLIEGPPSRPPARPRQDPRGQGARRRPRIRPSPAFSAPPPHASDMTDPQAFRPDGARFDLVPEPLFHALVLVDYTDPRSAQGRAARGHGRAPDYRRRCHPAASGAFMVVAAQNSIEHEGTFPLPEAQRDRFLLHVARDNQPEIARVVSSRCTVSSACRTGGSCRASWWLTSHSSWASSAIGSETRTSPGSPSPEKVGSTIRPHAGEREVEDQPGVARGGDDLGPMVGDPATAATAWSRSLRPARHTRPPRGLPRRWHRRSPRSAGRRAKAGPGGGCGCRCRPRGGRCRPWRSRRGTPGIQPAPGRHRPRPTPAGRAAGVVHEPAVMPHPRRAPAPRCPSAPSRAATARSPSASSSSARPSLVSA